MRGKLNTAITTVVIVHRAAVLALETFSEFSEFTDLPRNSKKAIQ